MSYLRCSVKGMKANVVEPIQGLGEAGIEALADAQSFKRADEILDIEMTALARKGSSFVAQVVGTDVWGVIFALRWTTVQMWRIGSTCNAPAPCRTHGASMQWRWRCG